MNTLKKIILILYVFSVVLLAHGMDNDCLDKQKLKKKPTALCKTNVLFKPSLHNSSNGQTAPRSLVESVLSKAKKNQKLIEHIQQEVIAIIEQAALQNGAVEVGNAIDDFILNNGAELPKEDCNGWTRLHLAAIMNRPLAAETILGQGALVDARGDNNETPLYLAVQASAQNVVKLLLEHGAKVDARDYKNRTILYKAAKDGDTGLVKCLLEHATFMPSESIIPVQESISDKVDIKALVVRCSFKVIKEACIAKLSDVCPDQEKAEFMELVVAQVVHYRLAKIKELLSDKKLQALLWKGVSDDMHVLLRPDMVGRYRNAIEENVVLAFFPQLSPFSDEEEL